FSFALNMRCHISIHDHFSVSLMVLFICPILVHAQFNVHVEVFDIGVVKVIMDADVTSHVQSDAERFLEHITDVYRLANPMPRDGFMVRIPLQTAVEVKNEWLDSLVDEMIIIFPEREDPYMMVYDDENRPHFFAFEGDTATFLM